MKDHNVNNLRADRNVIWKFVQWLHELAKELDGELVLVAMEQRPGQGKPQLRNHRFKVGNVDEMANIAVQEATKDWANVYFGSYVVRPGLPSWSRHGYRGQPRGTSSCRCRCRSRPSGRLLSWAWACSCWCSPCPASTAGGAGARPDHPISCRCCHTAT